MPVQKNGSSLESFTFYLSLLLLATVIGSFFYLRYQVGQSNAKLADISAQAAKTKTAEQKKLESRILTAQQQMRDFAAILNARKMSSDFFDKFESLVFPDVYFSACSLDIDSMTASLAGHAVNFEALGRQMAVFEGAADMVSRINLVKADAIDSGGVDFNIDITMKQQAAAVK